MPAEQEHALRVYETLLVRLGHWEGTIVGVGGGGGGGGGEKGAGGVLPFSHHGYCSSKMIGQPSHPHFST